MKESQERRPYAELEARIEYTFGNPRLLKIALTHSSFANESGRSSPHNERLEFLGDSVLQLVITAALFSRFPAIEEGVLSKVRASLVEARHLAQVGQRLDLQECLRVGRSLEQEAHRRVLSGPVANALEAVMGAIFLDGGFESAERVILKMFEGALDRVTLAQGGLARDHKTILQELCVKKFKELPTYQLLGEGGLAHCRQFKLGVYIRGKQVGEGVGSSKKEASQGAAGAALKWLERHADAIL